MLPVLLLLLAGWMFRHPSSVHDNGRIGIGFGLFVITIAGFCHVAGGRPQPREGLPALSEAGGLFGWMLGEPLALLLTDVGAYIVLGAAGRAQHPDPHQDPAEPHRPSPRRAVRLDVRRRARPSRAEHGCRGRRRRTSDDPSLPWWRRNKTGREKDPTAGIGSQDLTELLPAGLVAGRVRAGDRAARAAPLA